MKLLLKILLLLIALSSNLHAQKVLRFTGQPDNAHSYHGPFYPDNVDLGRFYYDAWVKPRSSGYLWSDGYGGPHALLWGWNGGLPGPVNGNVWNGTNITSFIGTYHIAPDEWCHLAVAWDGQHIYTYVNGVPDSKTPFTGPRRSLYAGGGGHAYLGGSDHLNAGCDVAMFRCWDRLAALFMVPEPAFRPERTVARWRAAIPCDLLVEPGESLLDSSPRGCSSNAADPNDREFHHGRLSVTNPNMGPMPLRLNDPTCPYGQDYTSPLPDEIIPAPLAPPIGALVFDSFGRRNQTYAFQLTPSLGTTELGGRVWQTGGSGSWGILGGWAVPLVPTNILAVAWVDTGISDADVRVTRWLNPLLSQSVGLSFRVVDGQNYWRCTFDPTNHIRLGCIEGGVYTHVASIAHFPQVPTFSTLRVTCNVNTIRVYVDEGGGFVQVGTDVTNPKFQGAIKHGLAGEGNALLRCKNFTVFGM